LGDKERERERRGMGDCTNTHGPFKFSVSWMPFYSASMFFNPR